MLIDDVDLARSAMLLDVDGTLLDIAASPHDVAVQPRLKEALRQIADLTGGALAFVSGRPVADIDRLFSPLQVAAIGGHGAEIRLPGQPVRLHAAPIDDKLRRRFAEVAAEVDGTFLEDKQYSLALHYRGALQQADAVHKAVAAACSGYSPVALEMLPGKAVIEVKPPYFNKGTAVRELMAQPPFAGRRPVFIGDDITDQAVFDVLPEFGGLGFSVGQRIDGLAGCFAAPADVRDWLYRTLARSRMAEAQRL